MSRLWDLDDIAGVSDLAPRYGVSMAAVANWATRYADFPQVLVHVGGRAIYSISEVDAWYDGQFGDRPDKLRERAAELERRARELREAARREDGRRQRGAAPPARG